MAKLKAPLMSLGASGQLGKALTFFPWKGLDLVREYVIPTNPQTTLQVTHRAFLTAAVAMIHASQAQAANPLDEDDVSAYALWGSTFATPRTWFNQCVKNFLDQSVAGLTTNVFRNGTTTPGAGTLAVSLLRQNIVITAGWFNYGTSKTALIHRQAAVPADPSYSATLAGLTAGVKYYWQFRPTTPVGQLGVRSGIYYGYPT